MLTDRIRSLLPIAATALLALLAGYLIARVKSPKGLEYAARKPNASLGTSQRDGPQTAYTPDPERQKERKAQIDRFIKGNWFRKVESSGTLPTVWVEPLFFSLSVDDKREYIALVFAYHYPVTWATGIADGNEIVVIRHANTDREIGTYSALAGLRMD